MFAMNSLPSSIEKYLTEDAGFSGTELLSLRHFLRGDALTLRELAAKTGKSTGTLDQAVKKLIKRKILCRESVNGSPKFTLSSPKAIRAWMKRDIREKQNLLRQKEQNFESFLHSITLNIARPRIEYFEGEEGLKKAYRKLLDLTERELLLYLPLLHKEEEDPLREFRRQYLRERRRQKIFLRVISHNTPLGRRFQSRDPFEYRQTVLVPESGCPMTLEKIIAGGTIACFNHVEHRACFIHYPELAQAERRLFEVAVRKAERRGEQQQRSASDASSPAGEQVVSGVGGLFLGKRSLVGALLCAVAASAIVQALHMWLKTR